MSRNGERLQDEGSRLQVVVAGGTAGLISRFVVAPLDVVKIRLQLQPHPRKHVPGDHHHHHPRHPSLPVYKGTLQTMRHIVANEGITGLWKGNVPAELLYVSYAAVQFTAYRSTSMLLHRTFGEGEDGSGSKIPQGIESFVCGAAAGATGTAATYPLDLLRTRFAAQGNDRVYASLRRAISDIARDEGPRGFFRGLAPALAQIMPYMGLFFAAYEALRAPLGQWPRQLPFGSGDATAGVLASVLAKTAVFPLDLVRKRIQVQGPTRARYVHRDIPEAPGGTWRTMRAIVRHSGLRGLYRGLTVSLFKAAPNSAVTMWTYERILNLLIARERDRAGEERRLG
ncbi:mitochondrial thiamine pyrophosphate transporter [Diatrype stigma]|uniref:Mitochondrial thiamine pyrophosphate carrier 1 n=1 Tax=Diatrype stigma TaxID=117547 RepID=A0AAN9YW05_9PEZI